jgi:hypothetical protein
MKRFRFPLLFSPCCPCYAEIDPCYFFRGISLETLMESAFVDDIVVILTHFCGSPLYLPLLFFARRSERGPGLRTRFPPRDRCSIGSRTTWRGGKRECSAAFPAEVALAYASALKAPAAPGAACPQVSGHVRPLSHSSHRDEWVAEPSQPRY